MTLKRIIEKAVEGGYENVEEYSPIEVGGFIFLVKGYTPKYIFFDISELIFSHSFAKAYWGEEKYCKDCGRILCICPEGFESYVIRWKYELQQLVLSEDRIEYLGRFLD